jgi:hypothetical protein
MRENGGSLKTFWTKKNAEIADGLADLVSAFVLHEVTPQTQGRDIGLDVLLVNSGPRLGDGGFAEICSEDLDRDIQALFREKFDQ